jgi:hypothetical protein
MLLSKSRAALAVLFGLTARLSAAQDEDWPFQTFKSEPAFQPPKLEVTKSGQPAPGYLFFAPAAEAHQTAPLIMTDDSELIWHGQNHNAAFNFGVQHYRGEPVLVYWNGTIFPEPVGRGYGTVVIMDNTYSVIANVTLPGNFVTSDGPTFESNIDLHEIYITNRDTVLVTANNVTQTDMTSVGGPKKGWIVDCLVYEIDIATNRVLFRWSALEHEKEIPLTASVYPVGTEGFTGKKQSLAWGELSTPTGDWNVANTATGYFHINAVAPLNDGYIISSRYTCSIIALDGHGNVLWRLSGRDGADFTKGPDTDFCYQHDIRPVYDNPRTYQTGKEFSVHLHDNANCPTDNGTTPTSGLRLHLDTKNHHVTLGQRYQNPRDPLFSTAQGNFQPVGSSGHVLLGHGFIPFIEEFTSDGSIVETIQFGAGTGTISYRSFRQEWVGCPTKPPSVKVVDHPKVGKMTVYMSWNGATEFDQWIIRGPGKNGVMHRLKTVSRDGFETSVTIPRASQVQVEAVMNQSECKCKNQNEANRSKVVKVF